MITHDENGNLLFPEEYCKVNNIQPLTNDDCFCYLENIDTSNIETYFKENFHNLNFFAAMPDFHVWRHAIPSYEDLQELIKNNKSLTKIDNVLKISSCLIMEISHNSWVSWHYDYPRKGPALNLLLTSEGQSHSMFTHSMYDFSGLVECRYRPHQFLLYNTEIVHSVLNLGNTRYLFSMGFERGKTDLEWNEAKEILQSLK